jgi:hypothetical protein
MELAPHEERVMCCSTRVDILARLQVTEEQAARIAWGTPDRGLGARRDASSGAYRT